MSVRYPNSVDFFALLSLVAGIISFLVNSEKE